MQFDLSCPIGLCDLLKLSHPPNTMWQFACSELSESSNTGCKMKCDIVYTVGSAPCDKRCHPEHQAIFLPLGRVCRRIFINQGYLNLVTQSPSSQIYLPYQEMGQNKLQVRCAYICQGNLSENPTWLPPSPDSPFFLKLKTLHNASVSPTHAGGHLRIIH